MLANRANRLQDDMSSNMKSISEYGFYDGADMRPTYEDVCSPPNLPECPLIHPSDLDRALGDIPRMGCKQRGSRRFEISASPVIPTQQYQQVEANLDCKGSSGLLSFTV
jgi:hypothetical protein